MSRRLQRPEPEAIGDWPACDLCEGALDDPDLTWREAWDLYDDSKPLHCTACAEVTP